MQDRGYDPINNLLYRTRNHALDSDGRLRVEILCRSCGYILFGLHESDRCPECGSPVAASLEGELLRTCRPDWLAGVAASVRANAWSTLALMILITTVLFVRINMAWEISVVAMLGLWAWTSWRSSRQEPSAFAMTRLQVIVRAAASLAILAAVTLLLLNAYWGGPGHLRTALLVLAWLGFVIAQVAQLRLLADLAHRIPQSDAGWAAHGRAMVMAWINAGCGVALILEFMGVRLCCLTLGAILATWWIIILSAMTQLLIADFLKIEAKAAEEHWNFHEQVSQFRKAGKS